MEAHESHFWPAPGMTHLDVAAGLFAASQLHSVFQLWPKGIEGDRTMNKCRHLCTYLNNQNWYIPGRYIIALRAFVAVAK